MYRPRTRHFARPEFARNGEYIGHDIASARSFDVDAFPRRRYEKTRGYAAPKVEYVTQKSSELRLSAKNNAELAKQKTAELSLSAREALNKFVLRVKNALGSRREEDSDSTETEELVSEAQDPIGV